MNYSNDFKFKNYFSSRNRSLTKDQKSILDFYQEKISLESFSKLDQINEYKNISLEIGFGVGDILLHNALNFPNNLLVGIEYYKKGIAQLLLNMEKHNLKNIRLFYGDALDYLKLAKTNYLDEILIMFPDTWPKRRHHKRRFVSKEFLDPLIPLIRPGGELYVATDIGDYVRQTLLSIRAYDNLWWTAEGPKSWRVPWQNWVKTRYERKAIAAGRRSYYLTFEKF